MIIQRDQSFEFDNRLSVIPPLGGYLHLVLECRIDRSNPKNEKMYIKDDRIMHVNW